MKPSAHRPSEDLSGIYRALDRIDRSLDRIERAMAVNRWLTVALIVTLAARLAFT